MRSSAQLALGQKIDALSLRLSKLEQELAALRQDISKVLFLLEQRDDDHGKVDEH